MSGSAWSARPSVTKSASPTSSSASATLASTIRPATLTGTAALPRMRRLSGARHAGLISIGWTIQTADS
jgi:hypothetical protein